MSPFPISNFNWNWQHWHWQHFHIGNILRVILIYIPVYSAGGGLAYNFIVHKSQLFTNATIATNTN